MLSEGADRDLLPAKPTTGTAGLRCRIDSEVQRNRRTGRVLVRGLLCFGPGREWPNECLANLREAIAFIPEHKRRESRTEISKDN